MSPGIPGENEKLFWIWPFWIGRLVLAEQKLWGVSTSIRTLLQLNIEERFWQTAVWKLARLKLWFCAWPVRIRRLDSATAVSSVWSAKNIRALSMTANRRARNGAATTANSIIAEPSSRRSNFRADASADSPRAPDA